MPQTVSAGSIQLDPKPSSNTVAAGSIKLDTPATPPAGQVEPAPFPVDGWVQHQVKDLPSEEQTSRPVALRP